VAESGRETSVQQPAGILARDWPAEVSISRSLFD
jgi:hypothetical protein